ncbi:hypothetical protein WN943_029358 [Citrus x changshan-huyou]
MAAEYEHFSHKMLAFLENCTSMSHEGPCGRTVLRAAVMQLDFRKFDYTLSVRISIFRSFPAGFVHALSCPREEEFVQRCWQRTISRWCYIHDDSAKLLRPDPNAVARGVVARPGSNYLVSGCSHKVKAAASRKNTVTDFLGFFEGSFPFVYPGVPIFKGCLRFSQRSGTP